MASLFPHSFISHPSFADPSPSSFHPLFRLLDDFDQYSRSTGSNEGSRHHQRSVMKTFTPRFDVKETADTYELHGDLPGIEQKDITIEFTDAETLTVRGRTERSFSSGTPPTSGAIEGSKTQDTIKDKAHQPTIEDEGETSVATTSDSKTAVKEAKKEEEEPKERYWVTERSVGEFQRTFTFPVRVDQDNVKASMRNGVLTVIVPKGKKAEPRRIQIN